MNLHRIIHHHHHHMSTGGVFGVSTARANPFLLWPPLRRPLSHQGEGNPPFQTSPLIVRNPDQFVMRSSRVALQHALFNVRTPRRAGRPTGFQTIQQTA